MYYRIMRAPPGYPEDQKYLVGRYKNADTCDGFAGYLKKEDGTRFAATLEEARYMLPENSTLMPFKPVDQFLELWNDNVINNK